MEMIRQNAKSLKPALIAGINAKTNLPVNLYSVKVNVLEDYAIESIEVEKEGKHVSRNERYSPISPEFLAFVPMIEMSDEMNGAKIEALIFEYQKTGDLLSLKIYFSRNEEKLFETIEF